MKGKCYFFRDAKDYFELVDKTKTATINKEKSCGYTIRERIVLSEEKFNEFCNKFICTYDFITPHRVFLNMNDKYQYECLEITCDTVTYSVLVNTGGYSYPRFTGVISK